MEVIIMIGISGVGKTTWANKLFTQHVQISLDKISNPNRKKENIMIEESLKQQHNIVIDDTNLTRKIRSKIITLAKKYNAQINAVFIDLPMCKIQINNINRETPLDKVVLYAQKKQLEEPCEDEGFDFIQKIVY